MLPYRDSLGLAGGASCALREDPPADIGAGEGDLLRLGRLVGPFLRELRGPLGNLIAAADMLGEGLPPDDPSSGFVRLLHRETDRLQQAVADLSEFTAAPAARPRAMDLVSLLRDILADAAPACRRQDIRLEAELPHVALYVWADPALARAALEKLPRHALDAMPCGGALRVRLVRAEEQNRSFARVLFSDTGPGVPRDDLPRLFEPFILTPGRRPGMALAVCRALIERTGGRVAVSGSQDEGLLIQIDLPLPSEGAACPAAPCASQT